MANTRLAQNQIEEKLRVEKSRGMGAAMAGVAGRNGELGADRRIPAVS